MWSPRGFERWIYRCGQIEYEDIICGLDDVHLLVPPTRSRGQSFPVKQLRELSQRFAKLDLAFEAQPEKLRLEREYDLFFFYAQSLDDLHRLKNLPGWRQHCKKAVCLLEEVWARDIERGWVPRELAKFDALVVGLRASVEPLQKATGIPCFWVPPGVDALRFFPGFDPPSRNIDVFGMGRRSEVSHRALSANANALGWTYLFDSIEAQRVRDGLREHRMQLAEMVKRTRFFIVNKARVDAPDRTGDQEEVAFRSFEGAAGGAILIGCTPRDPSAKLLFDWPDAHVHVPYDSSEIADVISSLEAQPDRVERARKNNVLNTLRRHDWAYRWQAVLEIAGLKPMSELRARFDQLERTAHAFEASATERVA